MTAQEYSFNTPSELFHQLSPEQQAIWVKEIENTFENGKIAQKEEMMNDAISAVIEDSPKGYNPTINIQVDVEKYQFGDKVKLIIVKEEQQ